MSIDLSNVIALALGSDDVLQIQDAIGTVLWQKIIYYTVNISAGSNGTVSVNGVSGNYSQSVPSGTVLTIEGTGNTGYNFDEWSDGNTTNPRTITVTGDLTLTAAFEAVVLPNYFYVEDASGSDNTLSIKKSSSNAPTIEVFKSTDGTNWSYMGNTDTTAITATVPANSKLYLKAVVDRWGTGDSNYNAISMVSYFNVGGNTMSLLYGDNFENQTTFPTANNSVFSNLFKNTQVVSAANLELPATTLVNYCYYGMFRDCSALTTAPVTLPSTTLANSCYQDMFRNCTSLTQTPALPATTLTKQCYNYMFAGCTSLTTAPATLPATTLAESCYSYMFQGCTSLTSTPALLATTLAKQCYGAMFYGCTHLTTAPVLPATTLTSWCYCEMFRNCTSLTTAPATLPATTLADNCYDSMFSGCTSLTTAPTLPATTLARYCYYNMFYGCTNLNSVVTYAQDISASYCLTDWLNNVSSTGDFYNLGTATYTTDSPSGIPTGWTEHTPSVPINVTIINTDGYTGATYQIDSETAQPVNVTGNTTFTVPTTATTLTVNRNGKGETYITGVSGMNTDTKSVVVIPVQDMSSNVTIEFISLM